MSGGRVSGQAPETREPRPRLVHGVGQRQPRPVLREAHAQRSCCCRRGGHASFRAGSLFFKVSVNSKNVGALRAEHMCTNWMKDTEYQHALSSGEPTPKIAEKSPLDCLKEEQGHQPCRMPGQVGRKCDLVRAPFLTASAPPSRGSAEAVSVWGPPSHTCIS